MIYVLDASFIVSSLIEGEKFHQKSINFFENLLQEGATILLPEIVLPEVVSGIIRSTLSKETAGNFCEKLRNLSNLIFFPIDKSLADLSVAIIIETKLKGADSTYVALAHQNNVTLITADKEQAEKGMFFAKVIYIGGKE